MNNPCLFLVSKRYFLNRFSLETRNTCTVNVRSNLRLLPRSPRATVHTTFSIFPSETQETRLTSSLLSPRALASLPQEQHATSLRSAAGHFYLRQIESDETTCRLKEFLQWIDVFRNRGWFIFNIAVDIFYTPAKDTPLCWFRKIEKKKKKKENVALLLFSL